jgi:peptidoglycan/xylan/chitin deacetylase (PgdA/CDA1 family)
LRPNEEGLVIRLSAFVLALLLGLGSAASAEAPRRTVAVTIDDLPYANAAVPCTAEEARTFTKAFLAMLDRQRAPVIGFANPGRGCAGQTFEPALLEAWLAHGFELGSHSSTHPDINKVGLEAYKADVIAAEAVMRPMLARRGQSLTWYRHPFLRTGATAEIQQGLAAFLAERGYRVAAVTLDNSEWVFAAAYARALRKGDAAEARRIGEAYVDYMETIVAFFEERSMAVLGREAPQVLLIHANQLNRDWFPKVRKMMAGRGYRFVSLAEAQADPAFAQTDTYVGRFGMSWLLRWGLAKGIPLVREPDAPDWVTALSEAPVPPLPPPAA